MSHGKIVEPTGVSHRGIRVSFNCIRNATGTFGDIKMDWKFDCYFAQFAASTSFDSLDIVRNCAFAPTSLVSAAEFSYTT